MGAGMTPPDVKLMRLGYKDSMPKASSVERRHFITAFHDEFKRQTDIYVPLTQPHGDLHLTREERKTTINGRYWLILSGGKSDFKTKHWRYLWHQEVADGLAAAGIKVVTAGAVSAPGKYSVSSSHPRLTGVTDLVGKTNLREFIRLIANADGIIGPVTFAMHAAAALGRPYVTIAGGVEEWWWEAYFRDNPGFADVGHKLPVEHRYLHTLGMLDCCKKKGCWKLAVDPDDQRKSKCHIPVTYAEQTVPKCMTMITPERVLASVFSYYLDGTLEKGPTMNLPAIDQPVTITANNGRKYAVSLAVLEQGAPTPPPILPKIVTPVVPLPTTAKSQPKVKDGVLRDRETSLGRAGGRLTGFVLLYGNYADMHARCLGSIFNTTTPEEYELRVFLNSACQQTKDLVEQYRREGKIAKVYTAETNCYKYPAMRQMFHDPDAPITTDWIVWFDDDTIADVDPDWLPKLCDTIGDGAEADPMLGLVGAKFFFKPNQAQVEWFRSAPWHKNKPFRDKVGRSIPNGEMIHFVAGGCWAMRSTFIKDADIPDSRLTHNGGDITIGEQVYQLGGTMKAWNADKSSVRRSSVPRRGVTLPMFNLI